MVKKKKKKTYQTKVKEVKYLLGKKRQPKRQLDCYGIYANGVGKIDYAPYDESIMKELGDLGKW